jgi:hypothetical protein
MLILKELTLALAVFILKGLRFVKWCRAAVRLRRFETGRELASQELFQGLQFGFGHV